MAYSRVLILGCGYTGTAALRQAAAQGFAVTATVRREESRDALADMPATILLAPALDASIREHVDDQTHVIVAFQADPATDDVVAPCLAGAQSIAYISSTGVFGELRGTIDEVRAAGKHVNVWTCNESGQMRQLLGAGVTGIITDYPDRLDALL